MHFPIHFDFPAWSSVKAEHPSILVRSLYLWQNFPKKEPMGRKCLFWLMVSECVHSSDCLGPVMRQNTIETRLCGRGQLPQDKQYCQKNRKEQESHYLSQCDLISSIGISLVLICSQSGDWALPEERLPLLCGQEHPGYNHFHCANIFNQYLSLCHLFTFSTLFLSASPTYLSSFGIYLYLVA